jgi:hypothetical protein
MAAFNKFQDLVEQLGKGVHQFHAAGHELKVYLSNELPLATDTVKADIAEITQENGYPGGMGDIQNDWSESGGTATMTGVDVVFTASGGSFGPLQYVPLYNETAASPLDALIGWWNYGSAVTVNDGETFTVDFGASVLTIA